MARALLESVKALDVSTITAAISVPTLVLHRRGDLAVPIACGRHLAATIGAQYVELDGADHAYQSGEFDQILDAAERFLTGGTTALEPSRVLTTILFTDIVDSTRRAARLGDSAWKEILERHVEVVRTQVEKAEGRVVKLLGDGSLCTFPGPARQFAARRRSSIRHSIWTWRFEPESTPVNASASAMTSEAWRFTSRPE